MEGKVSEDCNKKLSDITQALWSMRESVDALAVVALAQQIYSRQNIRDLLNDYYVLRNKYESAKDNASKIGKKNLDELISQFGEVEGEREFDRRREIHAASRCSWDNILEFRDAHPLIVAIVS